MKVAVPLKEEKGIKSPINENFKTAPLFAVLRQREEGVEVNLFKNVSETESEVAQVLLAYGVKKVIYPKANERVKLGFESLKMEVIDSEFKTLEEVIESLFSRE
ncbi:MAG: hypothetical protein ABGX12_03590 [Desulfurobacteriaceae bacterium]